MLHFAIDQMNTLCQNHVELLLVSVSEFVHFSIFSSFISYSVKDFVLC